MITKMTVHEDESDNDANEDDNDEGDSDEGENAIDDANYGDVTNDCVMNMSLRQIISFPTPPPPRCYLDELSGIVLFISVFFG